MNLRLCTLALSLAMLALAGCGTTAAPSGGTPAVDAGVKTDATDAGKTDAVLDTGAVVDTSTADTGAGGDTAACCKNKCGTVPNCGSCGGCKSGMACDPALHKCLAAVVLKKFGEACGPNADCVAPKTQAEVKPYIECLDAQCDSDLKCDFGLTFASAGVCSKACSMTADIKNNATGASGQDGVEDDVVDSDCVDATAGPAGADFRCVLTVPIGPGAIAGFCHAGKTFKPCQRDGDCAATEACGFVSMTGKVKSVCVTRWKNSDGSAGKNTAEMCNSGVGIGEVATCANNFCFGGACLGFCKTDDDCITAPGACKSGKCAGSGAACTGDKDCSADACTANQTIFTDLKDKFSICKAKGCTKDADCPDSQFYCSINYNDAKSAGGDPDPNDKTKIVYPAYEGACAQKAKGAKDGEACDPFPSNPDTTGGGACENLQLCIEGGCSTLCKADKDCLASQKCATFQELQNTGTTAKPEYVSPAFNACQSMPGAKGECANTADCGASGAVCKGWMFTVDIPVSASMTDLPGTPTPTYSALTSGGLCVTPDAKGLDAGMLCGNNAGDGMCKSGICEVIFTFTDAAGNDLRIGHCLNLCKSQADCAAGLDLVTNSGTGATTHFVSYCGSSRAAWTPLDPYSPYGTVSFPTCRPANDGNSLTDCSATKKCSKAGESCLPIAIGTGPDKKPKIDYLCMSVVGPKDPAPTKKVGEVCNADPASTDPEVCASGMCFGDVAKNVGYCSALCSTDAECGNGTVCDLKHEAVPRLDKTKAGIAPVCVKKKACIPCDYDSACHSAYRCTHATSGAVGGCAPGCNTDADCVGTDGGAKCEAAKDRFGSIVAGAKVCTTACN